METRDAQELRIVRGGQYGRSGARREIEAERLMRARFVALADCQGRRVHDDVIHHIAAGRTYPTRRIRKLLTRLKAKHVEREAAWAAVIEPMQREFVNVFGEDREHMPPAA